MFIYVPQSEAGNDMVAIKKIHNAFEHSVYTKRTLREIRLLRLLQHENIIGVRTILPPLHRDGFRDLYVVSDLMETDLSSIIKSPQVHLYIYFLYDKYLYQYCFENICIYYVIFLKLNCKKKKQ
jgi:serine/threonine protein kinase